MLHLRRLLCLLTALAAVLTATSAGLSQGPATAASKAATTLTMSRPTHSSVSAGTKVTVRGRVAGGSRALTIQFKTANAWIALGTATSDSNGVYAARVPTRWYGSHPIRVVAAATDTYAEGTSVAQQITIKPHYKPRGSSKSRRVTDARWNPCKVINYKVNLRGAPSGSLEMVQRAFRLLHAATGLRFRYAGSSNKVPFASDSNGFESGTITVAWTSSNRVPYLRGKVLAVGGSSQVHRTINGRKVNEYVSGGVAIEASKARRTRAGFGKGITRGGALLHELGHTVGLEHVHSSKQLMNSAITPSSVGRFGAGDLAGLRLVGATKGCF